jgi:hypothetical protein
VKALRLTGVGRLFQHRAPCRRLGDLSGLIATEFAIGIVYTVVGYLALRVMEYAIRQRASIQIA